MSEIIRPDEPVYEGGSMTARQFVTAEVEVEPELPDFEHPDLQIAKLKLPIGRIAVHHFNTSVYEYPGEWKHMSYIHLDDKQQHPEPIFIFRDTGTYEGEEDQWVEIANDLLRMDCTLVAPPQRPFPYVFEMYWRGVRGEEPIDDIIKKIIGPV